jgi:protein-S-isoprenylcysteine O-methyltransferase Ste14
MRVTDGRLRRRALLGLANLVAVLGVLLFVAAGTWRYAHGWVFLAVFGGSSLAITLHLMKHDPKLLERRVKAGPIAETRPRQKLLQALASVAFLAMGIVPALDHRFGWSRVPLLGVTAGNVLVALGFFIVFLVFRVNSFTSAAIEVSAGQSVIDRGPYAYVRHPMYAGALILLCGMPLALGSWWGLVALLPFTVILVGRLLDEESVLAKELPGYVAYRERTRYRLVPHLW